MSGVAIALTELAERCEQADGPSAELNDAIHSLLHPGPSRWQRRDDRRAASPLGYTGSLDAAISLVPEGTGVNIDRYWIREGARWKCEISTGGVPSNPRQVFDCWDAHAAALAICASALRARAGQAEEASHG